MSAYRSTDLRLTPSMASRKLLVLGFIRRYIEQHGASPSYGEIAGALDTNRERVRGIVRELTRDGSIRRVPGKARSITLPPQPPALTAAVQQLIEAGWKVNPGTREILTNPPLHLVPELDHVPTLTVGDDTGERADAG